MVSLLNGLSSLGAGVASFAGSAGLEQQKADLLRQQTVLADQLAGARQDKQNVYQSGENVADRQNRVDTTSIGANAQIKSAGIGAGATLGAAQINADTQKAINTANISAASDRLATQLTAEHTQVTVDADTGTAITVNSMTGKVAPVMGPDGSPLRLPDTNLSKGITAQATILNQQISELTRQRSTDLRNAQDTLDQIYKNPMLIGAEKQKQIEDAQKRLDAIKGDYEVSLKSLSNQQSQTAAALISLMPKGMINSPPSPAASSRPPLSSFTQPIPAPRGDQ